MYIFPYRCRSIAQEVEVGIFTEQIRFRLWSVETFATHNEVGAKVVAYQPKQINRILVKIDKIFNITYYLT